jgi:transposase
MLTVEHYELIRRKVLIDGMSRRAVAKELGHSRKSVDKALAQAAPPGYRLSRPRRQPALEPFRAIIDAWLEEDQLRPRKQRHTAQRVYERLRAEHRYGGSACTVRRYVARRRQGRQEVFMPLVFAPGEEAQVDWGEATVLIQGVERKVQLFCMRFCFSQASFVYPYESQNLESFLDGHVRAFEFFGGVPRRLAYDNLKTAVIQVRPGRWRRLNARFIELRSWHLFESRFCNVAKGNEKGHVENLVKRAERTFLTPLPDVLDLAALAEKLRGDCLAELDRSNRDGQCHRELWEQERGCLLRLPAQRFAACQQRSTRVDKYSLVQFDGRLYSTPVEWAHRPAVVQGFVDRVRITCEQREAVEHPRSYGPERYVLEPRHYLRLLERKPGCLDQARPFQGQPWGEEFALLRRELEYRHGDEGTRQFVRVLLLMEQHAEERVRYAVEACVRRRAFHYEAVLSLLRDEPTPPLARRLDLAQRPELAGLAEEVRPSSLYDQLRPSAVDGEVAA